MGSKRIRFGLSYKGNAPFTADVLGSVDVRCIERVTVGDVHHVLITLGKPRQTACIVKAVNEYNEAKDDKIELDDIVTFTKAQGYMQHPFYAPFDASLKLKAGEDGCFAYSIWSDDNADKKRAAKELEVDMNESSVKPSNEKRARTTGVSKAPQASVAAQKKRTCSRKQKAVAVSPVKHMAGLTTVGLAYELAKSKDETIKAKNHAIHLLETMLKSTPVV